MATERKPAVAEQPVADAGTRSYLIAAKGVRTGEDFGELMSALMADILGGDVDPTIATATINAGRQLLRVVEMQYRYATEKEGKRAALKLLVGRRDADPE
jgi:hypothetical protein